MYELKLGDDNEGQVKLDVNRSKYFEVFYRVSILCCTFLHVYLPFAIVLSLCF